MANFCKDRVTVLVQTKPDAAEEVSKVIREMFIHRGTMGDLILAQAPVARLGAMETIDGVVAMHEGTVSDEALEGLDPEGMRLAMLWNWKQETATPRVMMEDEEAIMHMMEKLDLAIDGAVVRDRRTERELGKIEDGKREEGSRHVSPNPGCYWLMQRNEWRVIPGFFGAWTRVKGSSEARACTASGALNSNRQIVDYIRASAWNQVGAYAWRSRRNASFVDAVDWEYVWIWEVERGGAIADSDHYSRWDGSRIHCSL